MKNITKSLIVSLLFFFGAFSAHGEIEVSEFETSTLKRLLISWDTRVQGALIKATLMSDTPVCVQSGGNFYTDVLKTVDSGGFINHYNLVSTRLGTSGACKEQVTLADPVYIYFYFGGQEFSDATVDIVEMLPSGGNQRFQYEEVSLPAELESAALVIDTGASEKDILQLQNKTMVDPTLGAPSWRDSKKP